jgi:membrane protease YdiL (CAAX protease family)
MLAGRESRKEAETLIRIDTLLMAWTGTLLRTALAMVLVALALLGGMAWHAHAPPAGAADAWSWRLLPALAVTLVVLGGLLAIDRALDGPGSIRCLLGPGWRHGGFWFIAGALCWLLPAALALLAASAAGIVRVDVRLPASAVLTLVAGHALVVFLIEALPEELAFRGYIGSAFRRVLGAWPAILLQAACFTLFAWWVRPQTGLADLSLFVSMGIAFGYFRLLTGSVWVSIGFHTAFQTGTQLLVGGHAGPLRLDATPGLAMILLGVLPFVVGVMAIERLARRRTTRVVADDAGDPQRALQSASGAPPGK